MKSKFQEEIRDQVLAEAKYFIARKSTVRKTAKHFKRSKTSVHNDLTKRLQMYDPKMAKKVREILNKNWEEKAIRGGEATGRKYLLKKSRH